MAFALFLAAEASGVERRAWLLDQWVAPPVPTLKDSRRHQIGIGLTHHKDAIASQVGALVDFGFLELGARYSQVFFPSLTADGRVLKSDLLGQSRSLQVELARYFATTGRHFGRVGVAGIQSFRDKQRWLRFLLESGILYTPQLPWGFQLGTSYFLSFPGESDALLVRGQVLRAFSWGGTAALRVGGLFTWAWRMRSATVDGTYEHMLISVGPLLQWDGLFGTIEASVNFRLSLDRKLTGGKITHPSDLDLPGLWLSWSQVL